MFTRKPPILTQPRQGAFVVLELVVVCGLLLFLFTLYFSRGSVNFQKKQKAACRQNLQLIHVALQTYANENGGRFPDIATAKTSEDPLSLLIPKYTTRSDLFTCPGTRDPRLPQGEPFKTRKIGYSYLAGLTTQAATDQFLMADWLVNTLPKKAGDLAFSGDGKKPGNNHDKFGGVILFVDGRVETTGTNPTFDLQSPPGARILNPNR